MWMLDYLYLLHLYPRGPARGRDENDTFVRDMIVCPGGYFMSQNGSQVTRRTTDSKGVTLARYLLVDRARRKVASAIGLFRLG